MLSIYLALIDSPSDKELFKEIYHQNIKLMKRVAYSIVGNRNLVDDAVQEAMLMIAKKIERFHGLSVNKQASLITIIARNTAINLIKKETMQRGNGDSVDYNGNDIVLVADDDISLRENYQYILSSINSLDAIYSDVLMLKYVYGYDTKTISEMLGVSIRTVDSRIYRGKKMLAKMMEDIYGLQESFK